jgi:predicted membrane protein
MNNLELKQKRLSHIKEIKQLDRKYTLIYSLIILFDILLIILYVYLGYRWSLLFPIIGLCFAVWYLAKSKAEFDGLYEKAKKLKEADEKIIKLMEQAEILENDLQKTH